MGATYNGRHNGCLCIFLFSMISHTLESSSHYDSTFSIPISDLLKSQAQIVASYVYLILKVCVHFVSKWAKFLYKTQNGKFWV